MVKIKILDIKRSFYDTKLRTIFLRKSLFQEPDKKIEKVLREEFTHAYLQKTWLNIIYEYRVVILGLISIILIAFLDYYTNLYLCRTDLNACNMKLLNYTLPPEFYIK